MPRHQFVWFISLLVVLVLMAPGTSRAQVNTVNLSGTVMDPQGLAVKGAKITIVNPGTGLERTVTSDLAAPTAKWATSDTTAETMTALTNYHWPGNIRELENLIERAVILSRGPILEVPLAELREPAEELVDSVRTMDANERDHILRTLKETRWILAGPNGAAARLGMKRTTLQSRMQKLGIQRPNV